jgi:hypothetical protein
MSSTEGAMPCRAPVGVPTSHRDKRDRHVAPVRKDQDHAADHAAIVYRA